MKRTIALLIGFIMGLTTTMIVAGSAFATMGTGAATTPMPGMTGDYQNTAMMGNYQDGTMAGDYQTGTMMGDSVTETMMGNYQTMTGAYQTMMGAYQSMMGTGSVWGGQFKIVDMNGDGNPEVLVMVNDMVVMMNTDGEVLTAKVVEGINHNFNQVMAQYMGDSWGMTGGTAVFDVVDMDGNSVPEIIVMDLEKIMILDSTAELMYTIPLPWAGATAINQ